jgi:argininosuccinate synthase
MNSPALTTRNGGVKPYIGKVVLAYSGGLDTSVIIPWLKDNYDCEVIAYAADVGQPDDLSGVEAKALASGATRAHVYDLKDEFIRDYVFPTLRAGAIYERKYLLGTSIARPLIAKYQVEVARIEQAGAVAHGCTGKGNDQVRFELTFMSLAPDLKIIAPWRTWDIRSREDALDYAAAHNIPVTATAKKIYSLDGNLWHLSHEGGVIEDPWEEPPGDAYGLTVSPEEAPDEAEYVTIGFEQGWPVMVDGLRLDPVPIVKQLNELAGKHGVGRITLLENRLVGMKSRGVYETPGGTILMTAHRELEHLTLDKMTMRAKDTLALQYADLVYNGQWFTPLKGALDAFVDKTQGPVTGDVRLKLYKGACEAVGMKSPHSLYDEALATFGEDDVYQQSDAEGFIRLFGLGQKVANIRDRNAQQSEVER